MTVDDLLKFFAVKNDNQLHQKTKIAAKSTISQWRAEGIPIERQAIIQIQTGGALKAEGIERLGRCHD